MTPPDKAEKARECDACAAHMNANLKAVLMIDKLQSDRAALMGLVRKLNEAGVDLILGCPSTYPHLEPGEPLTDSEAKLLAEAVGSK